MSKLENKLDELRNLFDEVGLGKLLVIVVRAVINILKPDRIREKLVECADAAADDYFTSTIAEYTVEPQVRKVMRDMMAKTFDTVDRWAR